MPARRRASGVAFDRNGSVNTDVQDLLQRALDATRRDALDESEALCQQAIALAPGAAMPHYLRATNFAHAGRFELAEACYTACLTRAPDFAIARFQLGLLQASGGRAALAHATWEPLLGLPADHFLHLFARGLMLLLAERWTDARAAIERGLAANHENEPLNMDMRGLLERVTEAEARSADAQAQAGTQPASGDAHFLLGAYRRQ